MTRTENRKLVDVVPEPGVADPWSIVMVPHLLASTSETEIPETDATIQLASARAPASPKRAARGRSIRLLLEMPGCPGR